MSSLRVTRVAVVLLAAVGLFVPASQAAHTANPILYVNFFPNGTIAVQSPDGTPIGTTSGTPTSIPAGYYSLVFSGPGGCSALPYFHLNGPGTSIITSMYEGAVQKAATQANFQPSSTYTWFDDAFPNVIHTFTTTTDVLGTAPVNSTPVSNPPKGKPVSTQDIVGSAVAKERGTLTGSITAAGALGLAFKGKSVGSLKSGRYTISVSDRSSTKGFMIQKLNHGAVTVTGQAFMGKHSKSVVLSAGTWLFSPSPGKPAYRISVT